jgi:peptide/nickel transport system permease protein
MTRFVLTRVVSIVITLAVVVTLTFLLTFVLPADPARAIVGPKATPEDVEFVRQRLGFDDPIIVQYLHYVADLLRLDLGYSWARRLPVAEIVSARLLYTAVLAGAALLIQILVGIPLGLLAAARAGGVLDRLSLGWAIVMISLPGFWVGLLLLYLFAFRWPLLPLGGAEEPQSIILPALALGLPGAAWYSRIMRAGTLEVLNGESVKALRARGAPPRVILGKHALRAALGPVLTMMALDFGLLFVGAGVLVESVFAWPGIGLAAYQAMRTSDIPLLMGCVLVGSVLVLLMNLLVDLGRMALDPRLRDER